MLRRKAPPPSVVPDHIRTRVARLATPDLMPWADQALYTAGRCLTRYARHPRQDSLDEAVNAARVLLAIMDEMALRDQQ